MCSHEGPGLGPHCRSRPCYPSPDDRTDEEVETLVPIVSRLRMCLHLDHAERTRVASMVRSTPVVPFSTSACRFGWVDVLVCLAWVCDGDSRSVGRITVAGTHATAEGQRAWVGVGGWVAVRVRVRVRVRGEGVSAQLSQSQFRYIQQCHPSRQPPAQHPP